MGNSESSTFVQKYGQAILELSIKYQAIMQKYCNYFKKIFRNKVLVFVYERYTEKDGIINIASSLKLAEIYLETEAYKNTHEALKKINFPFDLIRPKKYFLKYKIIPNYIKNS